MFRARYQTAGPASTTIGTIGFSTLLDFSLFLQGVVDWNYVCTPLMLNKHAFLDCGNWVRRWEDKRDYRFLRRKNIHMCRV